MFWSECPIGIIRAIRLKLGILVKKFQVDGGPDNNRAVQTLLDLARIPMTGKDHKNSPAG